MTSMQETKAELTLDHFGNDPITRVENALSGLREGNGVVVLDDESRENEADLIYSSDHLTEKQMALMIRECSGIVCVCLRDEDCKRLELPQMVASNSNTQGTAFTVSIEAAHGCTTGVSAKDRVTTIKAAANPNGKPEDLLRPGHTEPTVDLMRIAGLNPCGVLCELMNEDGTMARLPEALAFAKKHDLPIITVEDLVKYRQEKNV